MRFQLRKVVQPQVPQVVSHVCFQLFIADEDDLQLCVLEVFEQVLHVHSEVHGVLP